MKPLFSYCLLYTSVRNISTVPHTRASVEFQPMRQPFSQSQGSGRRSVAAVLQRQLAAYFQCLFACFRIPGNSFLFARRGIGLRSNPHLIKTVFSLTNRTFAIQSARHGAHLLSFYSLPVRSSLLLFQPVEECLTADQLPAHAGADGREILTIKQPIGSSQEMCIRDSPSAVCPGVEGAHHRGQRFGPVHCRKLYEQLRRPAEGFHPGRCLYGDAFLRCSPRKPARSAGRCV